MTALARVGFATRGFVYLLIGVFATGAAFRSNQRPHGFTDSAAALLDKPLGSLLVIGIAVGIACFAGWLAVDAYVHCAAGNSSRRWLFAIGRLGDAILYAGFMLVLLGLVLGWRSGGENALHDWVAWFFANPAGRWLVGIIGGGLLCGGVCFVVWAWTSDIDAPLNLPPQEKRATRSVSRYGVSGRGTALALIGFYLISAAIDANPNEAHGLGGVLQHLRHTAYGWVLLLMFALAFGASAYFDFLEAVYRRIEPPSA